MRRRHLLAAALLAALAAGCGGTVGKERPVALLRALPPAEGRLDLLAFPGYAEDGSNDPRADWVAPFAKATGCKTHVRVVRSSTELLDLVAHGRYDAVSAFGDVTHVLTGGHEVAPLNTRLIPHDADVYPALRALPQNRYGGRTYGVPHGRGANLLLWRTDLVQPPPAGWGALWGLRQRTAGRIAVYDAAITLADAALYLRQARPGLGIVDPYELDARQFRAVVRLAAEQRAYVGAYWLDETQALADYTGGNAVLGTTVSRLARLLRADGVPVRAEVPSRGTSGRSGSWLLLAGARHPGCAYRWLDWILSPRVNAQSARYLDEAPATPAACAFMDCARVHAGDEAWWSRISFWRTPRHDCGDARGEACADWFDWSDAWALIRA